MLDNRNISFLPAIMNTSNRMHVEFLRLLFLQPHRETEAHFTTAGMPTQRNQSESFWVKYAAFYQGLKSKVGLAATKTALLRINLNVQGCSIVASPMHFPSPPPPSFTQSPSPPRSLVCDWQTSPHRPLLVFSRSTCPPISPPPLANSFVLGPAVINTHNLVCSNIVHIDWKLLFVLCLNLVQCPYPLVHRVSALIVCLQTGHSVARAALELAARANHKYVLGCLHVSLSHLAVTLASLIVTLVLPVSDLSLVVLVMCVVPLFDFSGVSFSIPCLPFPVLYLQSQPC
jgi:hypothetical protein